MCVGACLPLSALARLLLSLQGGLPGVSASGSPSVQLAVPTIPSVAVDAPGLSFNAKLGGLGGLGGLAAAAAGLVHAVPEVAGGARIAGGDAGLNINLQGPNVALPSGSLNVQVCGGPHIWWLVHGLAAYL